MRRALTGGALGFLVLAGVQALGPGGPVAVSLDGPVEGEFLAVSLFGDASSPFAAVSGTGTAESRFLAVSVLGRADSTWRCNVGVCTGGVAVSGASDSHSPYGLAVSVVGEAEGLYAFDRHAADVAVDRDAHGKVLAVSGSGNATADVVAIAGREASCGGNGGGCIAVAGEGPANGTVAAISRGGDAQSSSFCAYWVQGCRSGVAAGSLAGVSEAGSGAVSLGPRASCSSPLCAAVAPLGVAEACDFSFDGPCLALGGSGASGALAAAFSGEADGVVAVAILGPATSCTGGYGCTAISFGDAVGLRAFSLTGNATSPCPDGFCEGSAIAVVGDAWCGGSFCSAVSVLGSARGGTAGASLFGPSEGNVAVSALGEATSCSGFPGCAAASGSGDATGTVASSALGDAVSCGYFYCVAVSGTGDSSGWIAVSATGSAEGMFAVSGCGLLAACVDV